MQSLTPEQRASAVHTLAELLISKQAQILDANQKDLDEGVKSGLAKPLLSRLSLTPAKLKSLSAGLKQIAESSHKVYNNKLIYPVRSLVTVPSLLLFYFRMLVVYCATQN